ACAARAGAGSRWCPIAKWRRSRPCCSRGSRSCLIPISRMADEFGSPTGLWPTSKASSCAASRTRGCWSSRSISCVGASQWKWTARSWKLRSPSVFSMGFTLALVEGGSLFGAVCAMVLLWVHPSILDWQDIGALVAQAAALSLCCIVAFYYNDLYDLKIVRSLGEFVPRLLQSFGVAFILLAAFYSLFPDTKVAQGPFFSSFLLIIGVLLPLRAVSYSVMRSRSFVDRVLVLGSSPLARRIIEEIQAQPHAGLMVVAVAEDTESPMAGFPFPVRGRLDQLAQLIEELRPDRIVVALAERRGRLPVRPLLDARMQGVLVEDGVEVYERLTGKLAIEALTPSNLIFSRDFKKSQLELAGGRALSLLVAAAGVVLFAPLLALIALAIKLESRGPVFFVQERVGRAGKAFRLFKFRTMHPTDHPASECVRDNGHRVTRLGKWLRRVRLDELPQFVSNRRGELKLVGPRPHPVSNSELFIREIPYYALRSVVYPGVTGWAQVRYGYANDLAEETEKMRYDLYFIKHLSLWFDLRILVDTVKIVLFGRGFKAADSYP